MEEIKRKNLFAGSLTKNILLYTLPIMATGMLQLLFNTADLAVVGQFRGEDAVGAVGSTSAMINLIVNLLMGLSVGASVAVAHAFGAKDDESVSRTVHTALSVAVVGGLVVGAVGFLLGGRFLVWMDTNPIFLADATLYVKIYFLGAPANMIYNFGAAILRSVGNSKVPLAFLTAAGIINVLLNLLLVAVFGMGVEGVAIATAVAQLISCILVVAYLAKSPASYRLSFRKLAFHKRELIRILRIGLPAGLQGSLFSISNVIIQSSVNSFASTEVVAGNTAAMTLEGYVYILMNSFSNAALTFVGQTMGARRYDRIAPIALRCLFMVVLGGVSASLLCFCLRKPLLGIFLTAGEGTNASLAMEYGALRLLYICLPYFLCGVMDVFTGLLRGMGYSTAPMLITVGGVCGLRLVWIYTYFASHHTLSVLYFSYPLSWIVTILCQATLYAILRVRMMKRQRLTEEKRTITEYV